RPISILFPYTTLFRSYPDMIFAKGDIGKLIEAGGVIKLDDLIEEKGDNLKAMYGDQLDRLRNSVDDPSIYQVGTYGVEEAIWERSEEHTSELQSRFDI